MTGSPLKWDTPINQGCLIDAILELSRMDHEPGTLIRTPALESERLLIAQLAGASGRE